MKSGHGQTVLSFSGAETKSYDYFLNCANNTQKKNYTERRVEENTSRGFVASDRGESRPRLTCHGGVRAMRPAPMAFCSAIASTRSATPAHYHSHGQLMAAATAAGSNGARNARPALAKFDPMDFDPRQPHVHRSKAAPVQVSLQPAPRRAWSGLGAAAGAAGARESCRVPY